LLNFYELFIIYTSIFAFVSLKFTGLKVKISLLEIFSNYCLTNSNSPTFTGCFDNVSKSLI